MLELGLRITFSLLVVLGLMWGLARVARRPLAGRAGGALTVLSRAQLGRGSAVAVVRVVDRALILGVTDGQVTLLGETDLPELERQLAEPAGRRAAVPVPADPALQGSVLSPATWRQAAEFLRDRTARRS